MTDEAPMLQWQSSAQTFALQHVIAMLQDAPFFVSGQNPDMSSDNQETDFSSE